MRVLGVDNGLSGALALLDTKTKEVTVTDAKLTADRQLDCNGTFQLLLDWKPNVAVIEACHNNNGLVEMGGQYIAICRLLSIPITKVAARSWMKVVLGQGTSDKALSVTTCCELFPNAIPSLYRPTPKGRKSNLDHNRAEAVLLAHYASLMLKPRP